jgi:WD40 repeat protein
VREVARPESYSEQKTPPELQGIRPFWSHRGAIESLVFSPDGETLLSAVHHEEVIAWDPKSGLPQRKYRAELGDRITGLVYASNRSYVAASDRQRIFFWNPLSGLLERSIELPQSSLPGEKDVEITAMVAASNPSFVLVGDSIGRLTVLDVKAGTSSAVYRTEMGPIVSLLNGNTWASVADARNTLVIDLTEEPVPLPSLGKISGIGLRDQAIYKKGLVAHDGQDLLTWGPAFNDNPKAVRAGGVLASSPLVPGDLLPSLDLQGQVQTWKLDKRKLDSRSFALPNPSQRLSVDPGGKYLASAEAAAISILDFDSGKLLHHWPHAIVPRFLMFEPGTHRFLAAGSDGRPVRYDLSKPTSLEGFTHASAPIVEGVLDLDANGFFASTDMGEVVVFDYQGGRIAKTLSISVGIRPHLAQWGAKLAVASERRGVDANEQGEGMLQIWDINADESIASLNVTDVIDVLFTADGSRVVYATNAGLLESWNYSDQQRGKAFDSKNTVANRLRAAPGSTLFALCGDKGISFFNASLQSMNFVPLVDATDIAFAYDGTRAVAATRDHQVHLLHFEGDFVRSEPVVKTPTAITALAISSNNSFLIVGEERGTISVFDLRQKLSMANATLQIYDHERWLTYAPDGRFTGEPGDVVCFDLDDEIVSKIGGEYSWRRDAGAIYAAFDVL